MDGGTGPIRFLNVEYFFRLLYESRVGGPQVSLNPLEAFVSWFAQFWGTLAGVSFIFSLVALAVLVYSSVRMSQEKQKIHHSIHTLKPEEAETAKDHARWAHIQTLIESPHERDWREAIMESDIMLEDALVERGFLGATVAERLKTITPERLASIEDAWEAHKVRNRIAHEGIAYKIDNHLAYRTIKKYERVFKELGEI